MDQGTLHEEIYIAKKAETSAKEAEANAVKENKALKSQIETVVQEKEAKIAAANKCVNDVKDSLEALVKQVNHNQHDLDQERCEVERLTVSNQQLEKAVATMKVEVAKSNLENGERGKLVARTMAAEDEAEGLQTEAKYLQEELQRSTAYRVEAEARLEEVIYERQQQEEELEICQEREQNLGDELERLTAAVDEKLECFVERERSLENELEELLNEREELQLRVQKLESSLPQSNHMLRITEMVNAIDGKKEETADALRAQKHVEEVVVLKKALDGKEKELQTYKRESREHTESLKKKLAIAQEKSSSKVVKSDNELQMKKEVKEAMAAKRQSQAELKTLKVLYESLQGQHVIRIEKEKLSWKKERAQLAKEIEDAKEKHNIVKGLMQKAEGEIVRLKVGSPAIRSRKGSAYKGEDAASLKAELELVLEDKIKAETASAVDRETVRKLRDEMAVLRLDKEEAVAQAEAVRGVLGKELDAMEEQLEDTIRRGQSTEQNVGLRQELEVAKETIHSLDEAIKEERAVKDQLSGQLRYLQEHGAMEAVQYLEENGWGSSSQFLGESRGIPQSPRVSAEHFSNSMASPWAKQLNNSKIVAPQQQTDQRTRQLVQELAEVRAEMEVCAKEDQTLHDSLQMIRRAGRR